MKSIYQDNANKWNHVYATVSNIPWEYDKVDANIEQWFLNQSLIGKNVLGVGCGQTAAEAIWLAKQGLDVTAIDVSNKAIEKANEFIKKENSSLKLATVDIFENNFLENSFDFVVDKCCFHLFDYSASLRYKFAKNVSKIFKPNGMWISISGVTPNSMPTDFLNKLSEIELELQPHEISLPDISTAIEPYMKIVSINSVIMKIYKNIDWPAWMVVSKKEKVGFNF